MSEVMVAMPSQTIKRLGMAAVGVAILAAVIVGLYSAGDTSGLGLTSDGPLDGWHDTGSYIPEGADHVGDTLTYGCQVLTNTTDTNLTLDKVELHVRDNGIDVIDGPRFLVPGDDGLVCSRWGMPSEVVTGLSDPRPEGYVLAPGEVVAVYFGLVFNGSQDVSVASGHLVDYHRGERSFRELFESQLVICQVEPCEPAELLQE